jgi:RHS repeat-associated protein
MTSVTDPLDITTTATVYDSLGRAETQTSPRQGGGEATYHYYFSSFRNTQEDPEGNETLFYLDKDGRTLAEEDALGHKASRAYDGQEHVIQATDARDNTTFFEYDGENNLTGVTNALGHKSRMVYDAQFRKTDAYDPLDHRVHYDYDSEHHVTGTLVYPEGGEQIETSSTYYENGLVQTATDGRGIVTTLTYDAYGNVNTSQTGTQGAVDYAYDAIGLMQSLTDQANATTSFDYDDRGLPESKTDPLLKDTVFTYYDDGSVQTVIDRNGDTTAFTYTPTGQVDTVSITDSGTTMPALEVNFTYDTRDNLVGMADGIGDTTYGYDALNRLTTQTDPHGLTVGYAYDEAGNLTTLTYPGGNTVTYTYDALNRVETVTIDWLGETATYHYDEGGRVTGLDQFNGTEVSFGYDDANRLISLENRKSGGAAIATYGFILDDNGNRTDVDFWEPLLKALSGVSAGYTYNEKKNRLLSSDGISYTYDDEGQLTSADGTPYTFDAAHRLTAIGGANPCQYLYDGKDNRLQATRNGQITRYIYSASGQLIAEADGSNNILRYYIYGKGLAAMVTAGGEIYCYHFDASANTIALTDSGEEIVNAYAYTPFGQIANESETVEQPFRFAAQFGVLTEPNGLYYMKARYYDSEVGRFISEDPLGFEGGNLNLYVYAANNPIMFMDPLGLCTQKTGSYFKYAIGGLAIGALAVDDALGVGVADDPLIPAIAAWMVGSAIITTAAQSNSTPRYDPADLGPLKGAPGLGGNSPIFDPNKPPQKPDPKTWAKMSRWEKAKYYGRSAAWAIGQALNMGNW